MAGVKHSSSKQTKTATKAKHTAQTKASALSQEKVLDSESDADDEEQPARPERTTVNETDKPKHVEISSNSSSAEEDESSQSEAEAATSGKSQSAPLAIPSKTNGVKRKADADAAELDSASESEDESAQITAKKARVEKAKDSQPVEEVQRTSKSKGKQAVVNTGSNIAQSNADGNSSALPTIDAAKYLPPDGYRQVPVDQDHAVEESDLEGLELWHISAPIGVPLSDVTTLAANAIAEGSTILSHNNFDYTLAEDEEAPKVSIFLPSKGGYKASAQRVSRSLSLRARVDLPVIPIRAVSKNSGSSAAANIATPAVISIRPQPEGLKMRYKPPAFGKGKPGVIGSTSSEEEEDSETQTNGPVFQFPRAIGPHPDGDAIETPARKKKSKKDKKNAESQEAPNGLGESFEPAPNVKTKSKALEKATAQLETTGEPQTSSVDAEDAKRLKAEKKARRLARKLAKGLA